MTDCTQSSRAQDYLDGELVPQEIAAFEAHLAQCAACQAEVAAYRHVFTELAELETWDPGPQLAERVLAEVMPRHAPRWLPVMVWTSAASIAASFLAIGAGAFLPGPRAWLYNLLADATRALVSSFVFLLKSFNAGALRALDSLGASSAWLARLGSFAHALGVSISHPAVAFTLWAALLVGVALLWWMRPREDRTVREDHHVGLLGI
jgi:anti-sigma factor RsiW